LKTPTANVFQVWSGSNKQIQNNSFLKKILVPTVGRRIVHARNVAVARGRPIPAQRW